MRATLRGAGLKHKFLPDQSWTEGKNQVCNCICRKGLPRNLKAFKAAKYSLSLSRFMAMSLKCQIWSMIITDFTYADIQQPSFKGHQCQNTRKLVQWLKFGLSLSSSLLLIKHHHQSTAISFQLQRKQAEAEAAAGGSRLNPKPNRFLWTGTHRLYFNSRCSSCCCCKCLFLVSERFLTVSTMTALHLKQPALLPICAWPRFCCCYLTLTFMACA